MSNAEKGFTMFWVKTVIPHVISHLLPVYVDMLAFVTAPHFRDVYPCSLYYIEFFHAYERLAILFCSFIMWVPVNFVQVG